MLCRSTGFARALVVGHRCSLGRSARWNSGSSSSLLDELVGSRASVEQKKAFYSDKYGDLLARKARDEGVNDVSALRQKYRAKQKLGNASTVSNPGPAASMPDDRAQTTESLHRGRQDKSGVKPLSDILDLAKAAELDGAALSTLWTTYHQDKGFLSASIPLDTYEQMLRTARQYPMFVLPLARQIEGNDKAAVEMHLIQWSLLPSALDEAPQPSTVLFTGLAEYQSRQEYAQPYLILTNYTDLASSHKVVLMRGEITPSVPLSPTDAQLLAFRLQNFYCTEAEGGTAVEQSRRAMLRTFHERPEQFDVAELVKMAQTL